MSIYRYEVTDKEWALIEPMIHKHHMGRPQKELSAHFNGILWMERSGARWVDLPERYGPRQTVYSRFCRWRDDGTPGAGEPFQCCWKHLTSKANDL